VSSNATLLLARRSIRARIGRLIAIALAIVLGVSFVVGSFVLADSMRRGFDSLFTDINEPIDLQVRTRLEFGDATTSLRDPFPADVLETVESVPGVASTDAFVNRPVVLLDNEGEAVDTGGAPSIAVTWDGNTADSAFEVRDGRAAASETEVALGKATAEDAGLEIGGTVEMLSVAGRHTLEIVGFVGVGDTDGFGGASVSVITPDAAATVLGADGVYDGIDLQIADGADLATVQADLETALPDNLEVVTRDTLNDEALDGVNSFIGPLSTGLLVFAFITAFVSAFLINNVFAITIGQRLRELALLRAIGGGGRQVRRLIIVEALLMSTVATLVGIAGGLGVAKLMLGIFNAAGAGFPDFSLVLKPRTVIMAFVVGVGITLLAVVIPARRAAKIPPVAAMRPELGFESLSQKRLVVGTVTVVVGAVLFIIGLFARPGGTSGLIALAGGGAVLLFLGAASVASTIAKPATHALGWPIGKLYGATGRLARDNAGRAPRRTSATAAALMIGVALVSASSVFAASVQSTFRSAFDRGIEADYVVTPESMTSFGLSTDIADQIAELPELSAVSGLKFVQAQVSSGGGDPDTKDFSVASAAALPELINLGMIEGSEEDLADGIFVNKDPAEDLDLQVGDTVSITFQNGETVDVPVAGIYRDAALAGNWLMSSELLESVVSAQQLDFFIAIRVADGVSDEEAEAAIQSVVDEFPQAELKTAEEWKKESAAQIDQLLVIITVLLAFAIIIAVLGISITLGLAVFERTREIGLMRAVGMTKRQTRRMVRWESVIVATFGALLGIVLGTLIGVALCLAIPDSIVDGVSFSVSTIVVIVVGAVIAGLVAALYPAAKASRMDVLEAIATE
jgi:putative ABC transport system permease protein